MSANKPRNTLQSKLDFKTMSLAIRFRDIFRPRLNILKEVGIKTGFNVVDYGCGPGSYITPLASLVGQNGHVYAIDVNPLAIQSVQRLVSKKGLSNIVTIVTDCNTGLPSGCMDIVLLYDILHGLEERDRVLVEISRVLKTNGILSVSDHHMKKEKIVSQIIDGGLFTLSVQGISTYMFIRK
jgi:ubiquinone/menaquinone biosynthesis C-methylase UbiE